MLPCSHVVKMLLPAAYLPNLISSRSPLLAHA
jgi:hypothetical protein